MNNNNNTTTTTESQIEPQVDTQVDPQTEPKADPKPSVSDSEAKLIKEVMEKKAQIKEQGEKIKEFEAMMTELKALGGIDAFKTMVEAKKDAEKKALEERGEWDKLKAQMADEHAKATEGYKTQIAELQSKLKTEENKILEMTIGTAFANSKFITEKTVLPGAKARSLYGEYFEVSADGQVVGYDKPRGVAGRVPLLDQMGNNLSFETAIEKIITLDPDHESLMRARGAQGSGSGSSGGVHKKVEPQTRSLSGLEMISSGLATFNK